MRKTRIFKLFSFLSLFSIIGSQFLNVLVFITPSVLASTAGVCTLGGINITSPSDGSYNKGTFNINFTRNGGCTDDVVVYYGKRSTEGALTCAGISSWNFISTVSDPGMSASWNTSGLNGDDYCIRLKPTGGAAALSNDIVLDNTNPSVNTNAMSSPVGGELFGGAPDSITWSPASITDNLSDSSNLQIKLEYTTNAGTTWNLITNTAPNTGTYSWDTTAIPSNTSVKVRLSAIDQAGNSSDSDAGNWSQSANNFEIDNTDPTILSTTLTSPNGGDTMAGGDLYNITWTAGDITDDNLLANPIKLEYSTDGSNWILISDNEANDGTYGWTVPSLDSDTVLVRITATDEVGNYSTDTSNNQFLVDSTKPIVSSVVATPNPTSSGTINVVVTFTETLAGMNPNVLPNVYIVDGGDNAVTGIADSPGVSVNGFDVASNFLQWKGTIDVTGFTDGELDFKVNSAEDNVGNIMDEDTTAGTVVVDEVGPVFTIDLGTDAGPVKTDAIQLSVSDVTTSVVTGSTLYGLSLDATCDSGDDANITNSFESGVSFNITGDITDYLCAKATDLAGNITYEYIGQLNTDNTSPNIETDTLLTPNGGEILNGGSSYNITWIAGDITDINLGANPITLEYSTGGSWITIASREANDGTYSWTVPSLDSDSVLVRIAVTDDAGNYSTEVSDAIFYIDSTKPEVDSLEADPDPTSSGTIDVTVTFIEDGSGMDTSIAPDVVLWDGGAFPVTPVASASHTNGYLNADTNTWEGTIDVTGRTDGSLTFSVTTAQDLAGNIMDVDPSAGTVFVDEINPGFTINNGTAAGPLQTEYINITVTDSAPSSGIDTLEYGLSNDGTCDGTDTYGNAFVSGSDFILTGDITDYLCVSATDEAGNVAYQLVGQLNTDNTSPDILTGTLTSPNGGEAWIGGSVHNITWTAGDITDTNLGATPITLEYSTDGSNWTLIANGEANDGSYSWTTPSINSDSVLVRITATDDASNYSFDVSDSTFTLDITDPTVSITQPLDGDIIGGGKIINATATDNYNLSDVEFFYNDTNDTVSPTSIGSDSTSPYSSTLDTTVLPDGIYYLYAVATDEAGNTTTSSIIEVEVDNTKPVIANLNFPEEVTGNSTLVGLATTVNIPLSNAEYFIDTVGADGTGTPLTLGAGTTSRVLSGNIDVSSLSLGEHTIYVRAQNSDGVWGNTFGTITFTKVTTPDIAPIINSVYTSKASNTFIVDESANLFVEENNIATSVTANGVSMTEGTPGSWTLPINTSSSGIFTYTIIAYNGTASSTRTISIVVNEEIIDTTAPAFVSSTPSNAATSVSVSSGMATINFDESIVIADNDLIDIHEVVSSTDVKNGSPSATGSVLTINYNELDYNKTYRITLLSGAIKDTSNNYYGSDLLIYFTTQTSTAPDITKLRAINITNSSFDIDYSTDITPDSKEYRVGTYAYGSDIYSWTTLGGTPYTVSEENFIDDISPSLQSNTIYYYQVRFSKNGQWVYSVPMKIKTARGTDGVYVDQISVVKSSASYSSSEPWTNGWHFRLLVTTDDMYSNDLQMKVDNWVSGNNALLSSGNVNILVSQDGISNPSESQIANGTSINTTYGEIVNIEGFDNDLDNGGSQFYIDMFVKIPSGQAPGNYSSSYGIMTQSSPR